MAEKNKGQGRKKTGTLAQGGDGGGERIWSERVAFYGEKKRACGRIYVGKIKRGRGLGWRKEKPLLRRGALLPPFRRNYTRKTQVRVEAESRAEGAPKGQVPS